MDNVKPTLIIAIALASSAAIIYTYIGILGVIIPVVILIAVNFSYSRNIVTSITVPLFALMVLVISDHLSFLLDFYLFNLTIDVVDNNIYFMGIHLFFFILFATGLSLLTDVVIRQIKQRVYLTRRYFLFILVLIVITIIFFYINILISNRVGFSREVIQLNSYLFLVYFIIFMIIASILVATVIKEMKVKSKQEEYKQLRMYSENLEELYGELQKFRHDYINILSSMADYIRKRELDNLEKYFNEKVMPTSQGIQLNNYKLGALKNIKVRELKGILVSKLVKAQELGINTTVEATEPVQRANMDSILLCRCLGIVLDNAIEETEEYKNSSMSIAFIKKEHSLLIVVVNTIGGEIPKLFKVFQKGFSTKGENRGLGLSNLKELVSQCDNVTLETKIEGRLFFQEIEISD